MEVCKNCVLLVSINIRQLCILFVNINYLTNLVSTLVSTTLQVLRSWSPSLSSAARESKYFKISTFSKPSSSGELDSRTCPSFCERRAFRILLPNFTDLSWGLQFILLLVFLQLFNCREAIRNLLLNL